jgi:iron complex outermembrane receptor protein
VGAKLEFADKRVTSTVAWFDLTKDNILTTDPLNPIFQILAGEARSTGFEADIAGEVSDKLSLLATYAYTNARFTRNNDGLLGNRLENAPKNQGSLWGTYDVTQSIRAGLGVVFVGERRGDPDNTVRFDGYQRADAMLAYVRRFGRGQWRLQLNVNNLFNAEYFTSGGERVSNFPGRPRNVLVSIRVDF